MNNVNEVLKNMKNSVGSKDPIEFFKSLVDVLEVLVEQNNKLSSSLNFVINELKNTKRNLALAINWDPKIASELIVAEIEKLRKDTDTYHNEISILKNAYKSSTFESYDAFVNFWKDTLGYHPFID